MTVLAHPLNNNKHNMFSGWALPGPIGRRTYSTREALAARARERVLKVGQK